MNNDLIIKCSEYSTISELVKLNKVYDNEEIQNKIINLVYYNKYFNLIKTYEKSKYNLRFNHPVKELVFAVRNINDLSIFNNYNDSNIFDNYNDLFGYINE